MSDARAYLFPGQGAQVVGMGRSLAEAYPAAAEIFQTANDILGYDLQTLCFEGPQSELDQTLHTQPALFVVGMAAYRALRSAQASAALPQFMAGHSLGEFTALTAAGALTFEDGLRLVQKRAELMQAAGEQASGAVAALLGLDVPSVEAICQDASDASGQAVVVANDNCPGQVVISGADAALDQALSLATERGAKRAIKLAVSVAVHSPLMQSAADDFARVIDSIPIQTALVPVVANLSAQPITTPQAIRAELTAQITGRVRWTESIQTMLAVGVRQFVELGAGDVLIGLVKRIERKTVRTALQTADDLAAYVQAP